VKSLRKRALGETGAQELTLPWEREKTS